MTTITRRRWSLSRALIHCGRTSCRSAAGWTVLIKHVFELASARKE